MSLFRPTATATVEPPAPDLDAGRLPAGYDDPDGPFWVHPDLREHYGRAPVKPADVDRALGKLVDQRQADAIAANILARSGQADQVEAEPALRQPMRRDFPSWEEYQAARKVYDRQMRGRENQARALDASVQEYLDADGRPLPYRVPEDSSLFVRAELPTAQLHLQAVHQVTLADAVKAHQRATARQQMRDQAVAERTCTVCGQQSASTQPRQPTDYTDGQPAGAQGSGVRICDPCLAVLVQRRDQQRAQATLPDGRTREQAAAEWLRQGAGARRLTPPTGPDGQPMTGRAAVAQLLAEQAQPRA